MKRLILTILALILALTALTACGKTDGGDNTDGKATEAVTDGKTDETKPEKEKQPVPDPEEYDFIHKFAAPEGKPRDIVFDHMTEMSKVKWVATESWTTTWKGNADFKVSLSYEKGKTYYGIPYARTNATLDEFMLFVEDGKFTPNSPYYEEIVGNHCSSSMVMAFQQIIPMQFSGGLKPIVSRQEFLKFPDGLEIPPARSSNVDDWISATVFAHNGQDAVYEAYTKLDKGDILYKNIDGAGHTRMVSRVEVSRSVSGKISPSRSFVYCLEQTNAWADNKKESTWFVDRQYSFSALYDTLFMPVTLNIYHEEDPTILDAYLTMKGKNSPETLKKGMLSGTVECNFPLAYLSLKITDKDGKVVAEHFEYYMTKTFQLNLRNFSFKLGLDKLPAGSYTLSTRAGIARGGVDVETVEFTKD